jgi:putative acetyltransferase
MSTNSSAGKKACVLIEVREERLDDVAAIRDLNKRAFRQDQEGNIVDALRSNGAALLSLVATLEDRVVGHILYSSLGSGPGQNAGRFRLGEVPP